MLDIKKLKEDLEQIHSIMFSMDRDLRDASERILKELAAVLESIDEHEALLKERGDDKLQRVVNIVKNIDWALVLSAIKRSEIAEHHAVETETVKLKGLQQAIKEHKS